VRTIRPYGHDDAEEVGQLLNQIPEFPVTSAEGFRAFAALSFNRGARDFRVLHEDRRLVGLLTSTLFGGVPHPIRHFRIAIHPACRRRHLATDLLAEVERQDEAVASVLRCNSQSTWHPGNAFLEKNGFRLAREELLMRRAIRGERTEIPGGFRVRPATADDDSFWVSLHAQAYAGREDFVPLTLQDTQTERDAPGFQLMVAEDARSGRAVGYCHALALTEREMLINSLVVHEDARGRGVAAALLSESITAFPPGQFETVALNVASTNQAAIAVYERLEFRTYERMLTYERPPRPEGAAD
jgi:mycothiol synthase